MEPARIVGWKGLDWARAEKAAGSLETANEEKKRRMTRSLTKSFSSPETNDWRIGEKVICGEATRIRPASATSVWGLMIDVSRVSPSIEVVDIKCGCVGYADATPRT